MSCTLNLPSLIVAWRLLLNLALLIGLGFSLGSFSSVHKTDFNLTCGDAIGLIQAINQANVSSEADTITLNADHQTLCIYT